MFLVALYILIIRSDEKSSLYSLRKACGPSLPTVSVISWPFVLETPPRKIFLGLSHYKTYTANRLN